MEIKCPVCGREVKLRKGKFGDFYGCTGYPNCSQTFTVKEVEKFMQGEEDLPEPADDETKKLRKQVWTELCKFYNTDDPQQKKELFDFVRANTETGVISKLSKEEAKKLLLSLKNGRSEELPF